MSAFATVQMVDTSGNGNKRILLYCCSGRILRKPDRDNGSNKESIGQVTNVQKCVAHDGKENPLNPLTKAYIGLNSLDRRNAGKQRKTATVEAIRLQKSMFKSGTWSHRMSEWTILINPAQPLQT